MDRRSFLRSTALAVGVATLGPSFWQRAYAATAQPGVGPYGPLLAADANGVMLPQGFTSRILATTGSLFDGTVYPWHAAPDGGAVFPQDDRGWVYASNSEIPVAGGAGAIRFDASGEVADAYRILTGTTQNCAGGPTPWGTWLSCEEHTNGLVHECTVTGTSEGTPLPALGVFAHEAVTFDVSRQQLYLTEDTVDGRFYRFTPQGYPDLSSGLLEVMADDASGGVTWLPALNPDQPQSDNRVAASTAFDGGEGVWSDSDHVYFTTKGDNRVWDLDVAAQRLDRALRRRADRRERTPHGRRQHHRLAERRHLRRRGRRQPRDRDHHAGRRRRAGDAPRGPRRQRDLRTCLQPGRVAALLLLSARDRRPRRHVRGVRSLPHVPDVAAGAWQLPDPAGGQTSGGTTVDGRATLPVTGGSAGAAAAAAVTAAAGVTAWASRRTVGTPGPRQG